MRLATLQAFRDMGVSIEGPKNGEVTIHGVGVQWPKSASSLPFIWATQALRCVCCQVCSLHKNLIQS